MWWILLLPIITTACIAVIIERYILGVKIRFGNKTLQASWKDPSPPDSQATWLSDESEIRKENSRNAKTSSISPRPK